MVAFSNLLIVLSIRISIVSAITSSTVSCTDVGILDVIDLSESVSFDVIVLLVGPVVASTWIES